MISVQVLLAERSYTIHIGQGLLEAVPEWAADALGRCNHMAMIVDEHLTTTVAQALTSTLTAAGYRVSVFSVPSGESSKSLAQAERLWQGMLAERADRGSAVLAVGGGVVGDLAGFVAATYARGLPLIQIPTTLLSQVDSSVGGKTGINLPAAKNMVGVFWQPALVVIDIETLASLPRRELLSGMAEVVKYGMILDPDLFAYLESHVENVLQLDPGVITQLVARSCQAKADVVAKDERETTGLRAILNYGHTFAHAIESGSGYGTYLHGEAVAIGMHLAARCAQRLGRIDQGLVDRQRQLLEKLQLPIRYRDIDCEQMWELMQHDKKVQHGSLRFVLPDRLGHVELVADVPRSLVMEILKSN